MKFVDIIIIIIESEKRDKYLDLAREQKIQWNMKMTAIRIVVGALGKSPKKLEKGAGRFGNKRKSGDHPD